MRIYLWNQTWPLIGPSPTQTLFKGCHSTPTIKISRIGCWEPPEDGSFKLNVDRTLFFDLQEARVDFILNDNKGDVIMAASMLEKAILAPKTKLSKVWPSSVVYTFVCTWGVSSLIIESYCQMVVNELLQLKDSLAPLGNLFRDIKALIDDPDQHCFIQLSHRLSNEVAHSLACYV